MTANQLRRISRWYRALVADHRRPTATQALPGDIWLIVGPTVPSSN